MDRVLAIFWIILINFNLCHSISSSLASSTSLSVIRSKNDTSTKPHLEKKDFNLMRELFHYCVKKINYPKTVRIISYENDKEEFSYFDIFPENIPRLVGDVKPVIAGPDPRRISTGRRTGLLEKYHYAVLIYIPDLAKIDKMLMNVKITVNERWDRVMIITNQGSSMEKLMKEPILLGLKDKFFISLDKPLEAWADPVVYNNGLMVPIKALVELPHRERIGGNLHGRHMKVAGSDFKPWVYPIDDGKGWYTFHGSNVKLIDVASTVFNYTFSFPTYDLSYGDYWPHNKSWTGMYSRIFYPEEGCHLTTFLGYDLGWSYGVDYPTSFSTCGVVFYTNQPKFEFKWYAFILPFEWSVWVGSVLAFVFMGIIQFFVMYLIHDRQCKYIVLDTAMFLPYAMAMEQGLCDIPKGARYICLIWLMATTVLGTGYKATLRKNLSFPRPEPIPLTYEELAQRPEYTIILNKMGSLEVEYFKESTSEAMKNIQSRLSIDENAERSIRTTYMNGPAAVIGWSSAMMQEMAKWLTVNTRVDPLVMSKGTPKVNTMSMGFQKNSIFVDSFKGITEGSFVSGLMDRWEAEENLKFKQQGINRLNQEKDTKLYKMLYDQTQGTDADRRPLSLTNLFVVFLFLPFGFVVCAVLFVLEGVYYARNQPYSEIGEDAKFIYHAYGFYCRSKEYVLDWYVNCFMSCGSQNFMDRVKDKLDQLQWDREERRVSRIRSTKTVAGSANTTTGTGGGKRKGTDKRSGNKHERLSDSKTTAEKSEDQIQQDEEAQINDNPFASIYTFNPYK